jgi:hypothetical protein
MKWLPIDTAPKDGRPVWVRGNNWGDPANGIHCGWGWWNGSNWTDANMSEPGGLLTHLTDWLNMSEAAQ